MGYYVGDMPAAPLIVEPDRDGDPIDLTPFTEAAVNLYSPDGQPVETEGMTATIGEETVTVTWPDSSPFAMAGMYELRITLTADGTRERVPAVYLVADEEDGWHTLASARDGWPDAPAYDAWLYELLIVARHQCIEYAPVLAEDAPVPLHYRRAQLMQARNIWNAARVDPSTGSAADGDSFVIRPFPLDWTVKQMLRPHNARKAVG